MCAVASAGTLARGARTSVVTTEPSNILEIDKILVLVVGVVGASVMYIIICIIALLIAAFFRTKEDRFVLRTMRQHSEQLAAIRAANSAADMSFYLELNDRGDSDDASHVGAGAHAGSVANAMNANANDGAGGRTLLAAVGAVNKQPISEAPTGFELQQVHGI
jgi:hypothetical protein